MMTTSNQTIHVAELGSRRVEYRIQFSRSAKRCRIRVRPDGVEVVLPKGTEENRAESFLRENEAWVLDQIAFLDRLGSVRPKAEKEGHSILLRGEDTPVEIVEEETKRRYGLVDLTDKGLIIRLPRGKDVNPWRTLESWLRRQARSDILERLAVRTKEMPRSNYQRLYVMGQRTKSSSTN